MMVGAGGESCNPQFRAVRRGWAATKGIGDARGALQVRSDEPNVRVSTAAITTDVASVANEIVVAAGAGRSKVGIWRHPSRLARCPDGTESRTGHMERGPDTGTHWALMLPPDIGAVIGVSLLLLFIGAVLDLGNIDLGRSLGGPRGPLRRDRTRIVSPVLTAVVLKRNIYASNMGLRQVVVPARLCPGPMGRMLTVEEPKPVSLTVPQTVSQDLQ
jgi:hypothetical protein